MSGRNYALTERFIKKRQVSGTTQNPSITHLFQLKLPRETPGPDTLGCVSSSCDSLAYFADIISSEGVFNNTCFLL